ncbi:MAG: dienelactone hydrolase family protein [Methylococcaceae bacterium]|nr:dienelactone hydrolase family protein [Methylococcaceae bacterium]
MKTENHTITITEKADISSVWSIPDNYNSVLIIAHGAGRNMDSEFISEIHQGISKENILTVKFNFPYMEAGLKAPNTPHVLEETWQKVIDAVIKKTGVSRKKIILSGVSMGGRYATILASKEDLYAGIILFGYPLHAPGKPDKPRFNHLRVIHEPMLFFQGTRDSLCHLDTFQPLLETLSPKPVLHIIEGADHSFKLLKRIERSRQSVLQEITQVSIEWINQRS